MRYLHLDVFTDRPFEGNQLAVFPDPPEHLPAGRMQRIAAEMAFSETTFVYQPAGSGDVRVRIFTPGKELPMAGHPTIGTTFALAADRRIAPGRDAIVLELGVGPIPVTLEWNDDWTLRFAWMTQPLPSFGPELPDRGALADAFGVTPADLEDLPIEVVSCGVPFVFVPLRSRAAVDRASLDARRLEPVYAEAGIEDLATFFFTIERSGATGDETIYSRMLAPDFGIGEDPATGAASGPLGCYLLYHGVLPADVVRGMVSLQGAAMGRPSRIHISIDSTDGMITRVRIGGTAVLVSEGRLLV